MYIVWAINIKQVVFPETISHAKHAAFVFSVHKLKPTSYTQVNKKAVHIIDNNIPSITVSGQNVDDVNGRPIGPFTKIVCKLLYIIYGGVTLSVLSVSR